MTLELTVNLLPLEYRPHVYEKHTKCEKQNCWICDGGLALCTVCGGLEGALLETCPGVRLTIEQHEWNYKKFCAFHNDGPRMAAR